MCDQQRLRPAYAYVQSDRSLCKSLEYSMTVTLLTEQHLEFLSLKGSCAGLSEPIHIKMPHCWKSHVPAYIFWRTERDECSKFYNICRNHILYSLGWLEPLLDRIAENKSNVVCPVIDVIEDDSFKYQYGNARSTSIGGFDWNLQFTWHAIPDYERRRRNNLDYNPVRYRLLP